MPSRVTRRTQGMRWAFRCLHRTPRGISEPLATAHRFPRNQFEDHTSSPGRVKTSKNLRPKESSRSTPSASCGLEGWQMCRYSSSTPCRFTYQARRQAERPRGWSDGLRRSRCYLDWGYPSNRRGRLGGRYGDTLSLTRGTEPSHLSGVTMVTLH